jgi:hypothetical protein
LRARAAAGIISATAAAAITAARKKIKTRTAEAPVKVNIYPVKTGGWMYEVWIESRPVVVGWCHTREAAEHEASLV